MFSFSRGLPGERLRTLLVVMVGAVFIISLIAAFRPLVTLAVDQEGCGNRPMDVELIIDRSRSMENQQSGGQTRLYWAKAAANQLIDNLDAAGGVGASGIHQMGLTTFGGTTASVARSLGGSSAAEMHAAVNAITVNSGTPLKAGLAAGSADLLANQRDLQDGVPVLHVIVMLSDGRPNPDPDQRPDASEIAAYLASADVAYSIAIGEGGSGATEIDLDLMQALAKPSSAYRHVVEASDLPGLFAGIFAELACPNIGLDKTADSTSLPVGGGEVTYSYAVTNSSADAPLSNVGVTDDKCAPVTYVSGDENSDQMLQSTETWLFTCSTTLTETTTNVGTASGQFGDATFTATDTETVTVAQATPTPGEATPSPTPGEATPSPTPEESVQVTTPSPTPEQSVQAATGTPAPSLPDSALSGQSGPGAGPLLALLLILASALTALVRVNLAVARRRS